jgi:hypothetical protein
MNIVYRCLASDVRYGSKDHLTPASKVMSDVGVSLSSSFPSDIRHGGKGSPPSS